MPNAKPTPDHVRHYDDGANPPDTPLRIAAERAYREAFLAATMETTSWHEPDIAAIEAARLARRAVREGAEIEHECIPAVHVVEAACTRGRHQAFEFVAQAWERGADRGMSDERIAEDAIRPWTANVARWAAKELDPARVSIPPRPDDGWPEEPEEKPVDLRPKLIARRLCDVPRKGNLTPFMPKKQPEVSSLPALTLRQLVDHFPYLREPVIHGLLRAGETMNVIAASKTGKSWLVSDLALAVATGRPWLDAFATEPGNVLVIDNELHRETSAHRIPKVMAARGIGMSEVGDRIAVANLRGRLKDIVGLGAYFAEMEPGRYQVIILDAFYRFMPKDTDENDNGTMAQVYNSLDSYAARLGCSFVLVHHSTKGNQSGKSITDVGAGAGAQSRATDTHLVLRPHEQPDVVVLDAAVRSWPPIQPCCLRWTFPVWTLDDTLDPADLRPERPRRKPKSQSDSGDLSPAKPTWNPETFTAAFVGPKPATTLAIIQAAMEAGLSERRATKLLKHAEHEGRVYRWRFGATQPVQFAANPQPDVQT
jgi:hypothetical protein